MKVKHGITYWIECQLDGDAADITTSGNTRLAPTKVMLMSNMYATVPLVF